MSKVCWIQLHTTIQDLFISKNIEKYVRDKRAQLNLLQSALHHQ